MKDQTKIRLLSVGMLAVFLMATAPYVLGSGIYGSKFTASAASGSDAIGMLDGAHVNLSTADPSSYVYRCALNSVCTPSTILPETSNGPDLGASGRYWGNVFAGGIFLKYPTGNAAVNLLDGARVNFSTADTNAYFYRSTVDTIRTPGLLRTDMGLTIGDTIAGSGASDLLSINGTFVTAKAQIGGLAASGATFRVRNAGSEFVVADADYSSFTVTGKITASDDFSAFKATTAGAGYELKSPNGTAYRITIDNAGALVITAL